MPSTPRTVSRLWLALAFAIVVIGTLTIALIAVAQSNTAARTARDVADCVNRVQGDRAYANNLIRDAQLEDARAELASARGQINSAELQRRKVQYVLAQQRARAYAAAHPAGRC